MSDLQNKWIVKAGDSIISEHRRRIDARLAKKAQEMRDREATVKPASYPQYKIVKFD